MARTQADLIAECQAKGIILPAHKLSREDLMNLLAEYYIEEQGLAPVVQIEPMLARDAKEWFDLDAPTPYDTLEMRRRFWDNPGWVAEEKLDGNRFKMHILGDGAVRFDSRRRSDKNYIFAEKTGNFPHLTKPLPELAGTVLDGEVMCPDANIWTGKVQTARTTQSTSAIANSGPDQAVWIQETNECWVVYHAFDILYFRGEPVMHLPWTERRAMLEKAVAVMVSNHQDLIPYVKVVPYQHTDKYAFLQWILQNGGEGVMLKNMNAPYQPGIRSKGMYKVKEFLTVDAFITGYIPGEAGWTGLVGALEVSVYVNGKPHTIGSFSGFTMEERYAMTAQDGSLRPEYYGRVVEIRGQALSKNKRFSHCVMLGWRPDKTDDMCNGNEIEGLM